MEPDEDPYAATTEGTAMGGLPSTANAYQAYQKQQTLVENQIRNNMSMLMQARDRLREQRVGPSAAERLLAISAALSRPTRTGRFSEAMGNLSEVLGEQEKAKHAAMMDRDALVEKYGMNLGQQQLELLQSGLTGAGTVLGRTIAANKSQQPPQPTYTYDPLGKLREVPAKGSVRYPRTKEEYDAIPVGAYYQVPSGPDAGTIVKKFG
jgi:hypothetical protein